MGIFKKLKCAFISKPKDLLDTLSDHSTVDQIRAIPLPTIGSEDNKDLKEHSDYILQRKATNYKNIGRMDLAIACLEKANQIMPNSSIAWKDTDYLRLIDYLKLDGQFEKASKEEEKLRKNLPEIFSIIVARSSAFNKVLKDCGNSELIWWKLRRIVQPVKHVQYIKEEFTVFLAKIIAFQNCLILFFSSVVFMKDVDMHFILF